MECPNCQAILTHVMGVKEEFEFLILKDNKLEKMNNKPSQKERMECPLCGYDITNILEKKNEYRK